VGTGLLAIVPTLVRRRVTRPLKHPRGGLVAALVGACALALAITMLTSTDRGPQAHPQAAGLTVARPKHGPQQPFAIGDLLTIESGCSTVRGTAIASPVGSWLAKAHDPVEITVTLKMKAVHLGTIRGTATFARPIPYIADASAHPAGALVVVTQRKPRLVQDGEVIELAISGWATVARQHHLVSLLIPYTAELASERTADTCWLALPVLRASKNYRLNANVGFTELAPTPRYAIDANTSTPPPTVNNGAGGPRWTCRQPSDRPGPSSSPSYFAVQVAERPSCGGFAALEELDRVHASTALAFWGGLLSAIGIGLLLAAATIDFDPHLPSRSRPHVAQ
jgi:hypothetical protein